ncbi:retrovirus-related pol polyprotein from transposon TNT 1-94 [Tanacetum coccineum]
MARQCTQPKRPRNATWYKDKAMLAEAQEAGQILDEEQLAFLTDPGVPDGQAVQTIIPNNAAFQTEDLNTYHSDCNDISNAKAILMANISNYGSDVISEVPHSETYLNDMENQSVHALQDFEQSLVVDFTDNEIHSNSNIIPYSQYLEETQQENEKANKEQNNESVTAELEMYKERVKTFEQRLNNDLRSHEKMIDCQIDDMIKEKLALKEQVDSLKHNLSKQIKEKECLLQIFIVFKSESKEKENKYMENEIDLEKKIKELDNILFKVGQSAQTVHMLTKPQAFYDNIHKQALGYQNLFYLRKAQRIKPTLYDGIVISDKHVAMPVIDDEETLILEEKSRSKMSEKGKDPEVIKKNISHKPIDYEKLNRLSEDFGKRFTPQQEMDAEQAFWFRISNPTIESSNPPPVKVEVPSELPKVSLVNASLKKLKFHLAQFDSVVKKRTTPDARTEGEWGFEHTKAVFNNEIIPFLKSLKDIFNVFDKDLLNEIMEVQTVFDQMDAAVQQSSVDKQCLEIAKKELLLENDRLLQQIMSQDVLLTVMNSMSLIGESVNMDRKRKESCDKCFNLEAELLKSQNAFNDLLKSYSQLEKHCISLELSIQLNQEIFQKDESCNNQNALEILEFFENNDLKAQLQDKDSTICKLKDIIKSMREKSKEENVNYDYCEIETKNVELENSVAKLISKNERLCNEINHVKQVFKEQFDSIKKTRVRTKEQSDSLIDKLNLKSAENEDLKAQIQDKVFVITSLKNDLRKVKGKEIVDIAAQIPSANTIIPGMFKLDLEPLAPRLLQNREAHIDYLKYTQEQADILRGIVEQAKAEQPLDKELDFACKHAQRIQELLVYVRDTCPNAINLSAKKVAVTPKNKVKKVRFVEPLTSSSNIKQVESSITSDSNTPVLSPTGLKCSLVVQIVLWYLDSGCSKHMTGNRSQLMNFVSKFLGTVRFGNDNIARIMVYGYYQLGNVTISRVYYVEGLGHNLFSVGQFCDADLKVAFRKNTCFIYNLEGVDLLSRSRDINLYTISLDDMLKTSLICLLSKASKTKSWLWHRRLSHLNFTCALGKSKKSSHQPKAEDTNQEKLYLLHMDLCGPMRVASINGKRYILVIVDDYSRFTWVRFLRTKDEAPEAIIKCIKNIQVRLNATVRNVRTDNGTKFVNRTLREFYENVGISHQTSVPYNPQQNDVVERQNRTLIEVARTMLIFSKAPFALCYPTNDNDNLGKLDARADIDSPVSTSIDWDGPSSSTLSTQEQEQSPNISQGFEESPKTPIFRDDLLNESPHKESTSQGSLSNVRQTHTPFEHLEPKNFKQAMTEPAIDAMQEEIHEFQRLEVWELVSYTPMVEKSKLDEDLQAIPIDATLYRGMIGSLMYLTSSRPDLIYAVCLCARYQAKPTEKHLNAITRVSGTSTAVHQEVAHSLVTNLLTSLQRSKSALQSRIPLYCDNKSVIALCCNNVQHSRAKHIDVRYHFIKEQVENGIVELYFVRTEYQLADIFTKPLPRERFNFLIEKLSMRSMSSETLKRLAEETDE